MNNAYSLSLDLKPIIEKLSVLKKPNKKEFDLFLLDLANEAYDAYEFVICFSPKKEIEKTNLTGLKKMLSDLRRILNQSTIVLDLLEQIYIDTKNMDRVQNTMGEIEDISPRIIRRIEKEIKKIQSDKLRAKKSEK